MNSVCAIRFKIEVSRSPVERDLRFSPTSYGDCARYCGSNCYAYPLFTYELSPITVNTAIAMRAKSPVAIAIGL
jgi:hypothetical protein